MTDDQRKAMFARMRAKLQEKGVVKRALIGGAVAGTFGMIAYKNPALRKKAMAIAIAGVGTAAGYGGRAYQMAKDEGEKRYNTAQALGRQYRDWLVEQGHTKGGEMIAGAVDYPFSWAEGMLASHMDSRVGRIEALAAKRLQGLQAHLTSDAAERARRVAGFDVKLPDAAIVRTKLRREVQEKQMDGLLNKIQMAAMRSGQQFFVPRREDLNQWMREENMSTTDAQRAEALRRWLMMIAPRGVNADEL